MRLLLTSALLVAVGAAVAPAFAAPAIPTLSYFKPVSGGFSWVRLDAGRTEKLLAQVAGRGAPLVAWAPGGKQATVWIDGSEHDLAPKAWTVPLSGGTASALPLPTLGKLRNMGYDKAGRLMALTMVDADDKGGPVLKQEAKGSALMFEGKRYVVAADQDGIPALAIAYRRDGNSWTRAEIKLTSTSWDLGLDSRALSAYEALVPDSAALRERTEVAAVEDAGLNRRLTALAPKIANNSDGEWGQIRTAGGPVFIWREIGEFAHSTNVMAWGPAAKPARIPGLEFKDSNPHVVREGAPGLRLAAVSTRGNHMLVSDRDGGAPRLFETVSKQRVFASDSATGASFWP